MEPTHRSPPNEFNLPVLDVPSQPYLSSLPIRISHWTSSTILWKSRYTTSTVFSFPLACFSCQRNKCKCLWKMSDNVRVLSELLHINLPILQNSAWDLKVKLGPFCIATGSKDYSVPILPCVSPVQPRCWQTLPSAHPFLSSPFTVEVAEWPHVLLCVLKFILHLSGSSCQSHIAKSQMPQEVNKRIDLFE